MSVSSVSKISPSTIFLFFFIIFFFSLQANKKKKKPQRLKKRVPKDEDDDDDDFVFHDDDEEEADVEEIDTPSSGKKTLSKKRQPAVALYELRRKSDVSKFFCLAFKKDFFSPLSDLRVKRAFRREKRRAKERCRRSRLCRLI